MDITEKIEEAVNEGVDKKMLFKESNKIFTATRNLVNKVQKEDIELARAINDIATEFNKLTTDFQIKIKY